MDNRTGSFALFAFFAVCAFETRLSKRQKQPDYGQFVVSPLKGQESPLSIDYWGKWRQLEQASRLFVKEQACCDEVSLSYRSSA